MIWTIIKWFAFFSIINGMATKVTELKNEVEELRSKVAYTDEANMQLQAEIRQVKLGEPQMSDPVMHQFVKHVAPLVLLLAGPLVGVLLAIRNWRQ